MPQQNNVQNILLRSMPEGDFARLEPHLELVDLKLRQVIATERHVIQDVYFPESGICSVLPVASGREIIEAGLFGRDGMTDFVHTPGVDRTPLRVMIQAAGQAWRVSAEHFAGAGDASPGFLRLMLKYSQAMVVQASHTALSHGNFTVPERLARWLLMCQDRIGDDLPMVHDFLAIMLAVRRAGVTDQIHVLEGHGAIKARRGMITVIDRATLIDLAEGSYGQAEAEYERLIGPFGRPQPTESL
jgi:CRP-like cAMP-binding protein